MCDLRTRTNYFIFSIHFCEDESIGSWGSGSGHWYLPVIIGEIGDKIRTTRSQSEGLQSAECRGAGCNTWEYDSILSNFRSSFLTSKVYNVLLWLFLMAWWVKLRRQSSLSLCGGGVCEELTGDVRSTHHVPDSLVSLTTPGRLGQSSTSPNGSSPAAQDDYPACSMALHLHSL